MTSPDRLSLTTDTPPEVLPSQPEPSLPGRLGEIAVTGQSVYDELGPNSRTLDEARARATQELSASISGYRTVLGEIGPSYASSRRFALLEYGAAALTDINLPRNKEDFSKKKTGKMTKQDAVNLIKAEGLGIFANAENILPKEGQYEKDRFEILADELLSRTLPESAGLSSLIDDEKETLAKALARVFRSSHDLISLAVDRKWDSTDSPNAKKVLAYRLHLRRTAGFHRPPQRKPVITSRVLAQAWETAS